MRYRVTSDASTDQLPLLPLHLPRFVIPRVGPREPDGVCVARELPPVLAVAHGLRAVLPACFRFGFGVIGDVWGACQPDAPASASGGRCGSARGVDVCFADARLGADAGGGGVRRAAAVGRGERDAWARAWLSGLF